MLIDMPRKLPPYCYREKTRHGKRVYYFRRGKGSRIRLPDYGSPDFETAYHNALIGATAPVKAKPGAGSLEALIKAYRMSSEYLAYSPATRRQRDNIFLNIIEKAGSQPYKAVTRSHIIAMREKKSKQPAQARNYLDALRGLFRWAEEMGKVSIDPTLGVKNPKRQKSEGFPQWDEHEIAAYRQTWPLGTHERVWFEVLIGCGARRGDAVRLGRQHIKDGLLQFKTQKGKDEMTAYAPMPPAMIEAIEHGPCGDLTFIVGRSGRNFTKESFGNAFKRAAVKAGVLDKSAHGLRKYAASCYAEMGIRDAELEAMFGWERGSQMAAYYSRKAETEAIARNAAARIANNETPYLVGQNPHPQKKVTGQ